MVQKNIGYEAKVTEEHILEVSEKDKILSPNLKTLKHSPNNSFRFGYEYKSPVIKAENVIVLDPRKKNQASNGKIPVYKVDIYS